MSAFTYGFELIFLARNEVFEGNAAPCLPGHSREGGVEGQLPAGLAAKGWDQHWMAALVRCHLRQSPSCSSSGSGRREAALIIESLKMLE